MLLFFPLFYSASLFCILVAVCLYLLIQIKYYQSLEQQIVNLNKNDKDKKISTEDYYTLAIIYMKKKFLYKSILLFRKALQDWSISDNIGLGVIYSKLGLIYFKLQYYDLSAYYYRISSEILPSYSPSIKSLIQTYKKTGSYKKAEYYIKILENKIINVS